MHVQVGPGSDHAFAALSAASGEVEWESLSGTSVFSSPILASILGESQVVHAWSEGVVGLSPQSGKPLWFVPWENPWGINVPTPVFVPPAGIVVTSFQGGMFLDVDRHEDGWTARARWSNARLVSEFHSPVVVDGLLFAFHHDTLKCLDLKNGAELWQQARVGHGSLVAAGGRLLLLTESGDLVVVAISARRFHELDRLRILRGRSWTPPSVARGRLYARNHEEIVALDLSGR